MNEFDEIVEKASNFPNKDWRFSALESYIDNLEEFINFTHDQSLIRLKAKANAEIDPVSEGELEYQVDRLQKTGKNEFSAMICGAALVSIYFAYEATLRSWFEFLSDELNVKKYKAFEREHQKKKFSFLKQAKLYSSDVLGVDMCCGEHNFNIIDALRMLRNSYVHNGCSALDVPATPDMSKILNIENGTWSASPNVVKFFYERVYSVYRCFYRQASDRVFT